MKRKWMVFLVIAMVAMLSVGITSLQAFDSTSANPEWSCPKGYEDCEGREYHREACLRTPLETEVKTEAKDWVCPNGNENCLQQGLHNENCPRFNEVEQTGDLEATWSCPNGNAQCDNDAMHQKHQNEGSNTRGNCYNGGNGGQHRGNRHN